jgi:type IV secretion system protein TrbF
MCFKRTIQRYGDTPEPLTPYQRAGQVWDDRIGGARLQASNWRIVALGSLGLAIVLAGSNVWMASTSRITPYVVEVNQLGEARALAAASANYRPTDAQIAWHLGRFIANVRSLSTDSVVVRQNWLQAYDFTTDKGASFLNDYARANDPFAKVGDRTVSVQITSVVQATDSTYQVKWTEQAYSQGALEGTSHWTAMVTAVFQTPRTAEALRKNPLGIYVNSMAWSEEINSSQHP